MAWTIEAALEDAAIEKLEKTSSGYSIWLKGIETRIDIALSVNPLKGGFNYHLSHAIKTPDQITVHRASHPWGDYEAYALHLAISLLTAHYNSALKNGHTPSKQWLVAY